jgi:DNA-binding NarL/FixJ family response regulator
MVAPIGLIAQEERMEEPVRVLMVGQSRATVDAVRAAAVKRPPMEVFGPVAASDAREAVASERPSVVVVRTISSERVSVLSDIRGVDARVRVLVEGADVGLASLVLAAGGCGVLPLDSDADLMCEAILRARAGELVVDDGEMRSIIEELGRARDRRSEGWFLTGREEEVLSAIAEGLGTDEVALRLGISQATVQSHVKNVLAKFGVHSKVEAMRLAWREGLLAVPA